MTAAVLPRCALRVRPGLLPTPGRTALRMFSVAAACRHRVGALVVGAGPAGVATVGALLDHLPLSSSTPSLSWIDPNFHGGRINAKYRQVPGNTRTKLFVDYARATRALGHVADTTPTPNALSVLESLPPNDTCSLGYAGDMLTMLTQGLAANPAIDCRHGHVTAAHWSPSAREWAVTVQDTATNTSITKTTPLLVYCTGASPTVVPLPSKECAAKTFIPSCSTTPRLLELDTALHPALLAHSLQTSSSSSSSSPLPLTVGVIGASHSAILVLMNLYHLATSSPAHADLRVRWFSRVPADKGLKYAIYKDEGWILYDNTGLKGRAAQFARENLDNPGVLARSPVSSIITLVDCSGGADQENAAFRKYLFGSEGGSSACDYVVQAVGFTPAALPVMKTSTETVADPASALEPADIIIPVFNHETGGFLDKTTGKILHGLHGAGIAFPERVVDPEGNVEHAVGFFKFAKFLKRVVPQWVSAVADETRSTTSFTKKQNAAAGT